MQRVSSGSKRETIGDIPEEVSISAKTEINAANLRWVRR
jgi:hypothetical protein